jgi:hypothetical protein
MTTNSSRCSRMKMPRKGSPMKTPCRTCRKRPSRADSRDPVQGTQRAASWMEAIAAGVVAPSFSRFMGCLFQFFRGPAPVPLRYV